ncbi:MAG: hypothetical protein QOF74_6771 [Caballeronia mineralivorans]|jgi:hypothetical protein|nr:hypothetical protein [Caballeronia mineralivorans]
MHNACVERLRPPLDVMVMWRTLAGGLSAERASRGRNVAGRGIAIDLFQGLPAALSGHTVSAIMLPEIRTPPATKRHFFAR